MTKYEIREIVREEIKEALAVVAKAMLDRYNILPSETADPLWEAGRSVENAIADLGY